MSKVLGLDYGAKRTGIAITDSIQMIASPLDTVDTSAIFNYLEKLFAKEHIEVIVIGEAKRLNGQDSEITGLQKTFVVNLQKKFPDKKLVRVNEMFTSKMASHSLHVMGAKKSEREKKGNLDKISAAIILQSFLDSK